MTGVEEGARPPLDNRFFSATRRASDLIEVAFILALATLLIAPMGVGLPRATQGAPQGGPHLLPEAGASVGAAEVSAASASLQRSWGYSPTTLPGSCSPVVSRCSTPSPVAGGVPISPAPATPSPFDPPALTGASLAYDGSPGDGYVILFGGLLSNGFPSPQTWTFIQGHWLNVTAFVHGSIPRPRWGATMVFDPTDQYVVMFGGCVGPAISGVCSQSVNDTWEFSSGSWRLLIPSHVGAPFPPNGTPSPSARCDSAATWDPSLVDPNGATGGVVLYGGESGLFDLSRVFPPVPPNPLLPLQVFLSKDTWAFSRGTWMNLSQTGPPAMYGARMASDPTLGATILFGGSNFTRYDTPIAVQPGFAAVNVSGQAYGDTWQLSNSGVWTLLSFSPLPTPAARWDAVLGDDASYSIPSNVPTGIYLSGGINGTGVYMDDLWQFASLAQGWIPLPLPPPSANQPFPSQRFDAAFTFDEFDGEFVLQGGTSLSGAPLADAWVFFEPRSPQWLPSSAPNPAGPPLPPARYASNLAWDDAVRGVVLFGGETCGASSCRFLGDTWIFSNGVWRSIGGASSPPPRFGSAFAYDPQIDELVLFGGCGAVCPYGDTWELSSRGTWTELFPTVSPPPRYFASMAYAGVERDLVLFGGCEGSQGPCPAGDTWTFGQAGWHHSILTGGSGSPPARFGAAATSEGPQSGVLLADGMGSNGLVADLWSYGPLAGAGNTGPIGWQPVDVLGSPPPRLFASLLFDPVDLDVVLFGGCGPSQCPVLEPWNYSLKPAPAPPGQPPPPPSWGQVVGYNVPFETVPSSPPGNLTAMSAVWDPVESGVGFVLVIGGRASNGFTVSGTWSFVGNTWNDLGPYA